MALAFDAWVAPGNDVYFIFPFLQLRVPFMAGIAYWGVGPTIWGSSDGINLMPPFAEMNVKLGVGADVLLFKAYAELVSTFAPVDQSFSGNTLIVGLRLGL